MRMLAPGPFYLMGLMHGHWNIKVSDQNESDPPTLGAGADTTAIGIAVVVPAKKILEVLNHPELVADRAAQEFKWQMRRGSTSTE